MLLFFVFEHLLWLLDYLARFCDDCPHFGAYIIFLLPFKQLLVFRLSTIVLRKLGLPSPYLWSFNHHGRWLSLLSSLFCLLRATNADLIYFWTSSGLVANFHILLDVWLRGHRTFLLTEKNRTFDWVKLHSTPNFVGSSWSDWLWW